MNLFRVIILTGILTILAIILKLIGVIPVSWFVVFAPLIFVVAMIVILIIISVIVMTNTDKEAGNHNQQKHKKEKK